MSLPKPVVPEFLKSYPRLRGKRDNEYHLIIRRYRDFRAIATQLREHGWRLLSLFAVDERMEEDCRFKLYYLFTAPEDDMLLLLEYFLAARDRRPEQLKSLSTTLRFYRSIRDIYPPVQPFEERIADTFALLPRYDDPAQVQFMLADAHLLHAAFIQDFAPLRRTRPLDRLRKLQTSEPHADAPQPSPHKHLISPPLPPEGMDYLPVGPIHAGIIPPGRFLFLQGGEPIEAMPMRLGFIHRGIEKLFETHYLIPEGWQLAEKVSGDAAFSHALAYCRAVEALAGISVPEPAQRWRAILLELERMAQHIHTVSGLLHDISLHVVGSQMGQQWATLLDMHQQLFGDRYLRGLLRPGGIHFPEHWAAPKAKDILQETLEEVISGFLSLAQRVAWDASLQDRAVGTGVLTGEEALEWGATGFIARASSGHLPDASTSDPQTYRARVQHIRALAKNDTRILHPHPIYRSPTIQAILAGTFFADLPPRQRHVPERLIALSQKDMQGDVYARFLLRLAEVETSFYLIDALLSALEDVSSDALMAADVDRRLRQALPFDAGLGYAESARGGVYYWVKKGPRQTIARCAITGPSILNWFVFPRAVARKPHATNQYNILADFPLINKSFDLSYAEHDL